MKNTLLDLYHKDGTKKLLASLISILMGLLLGAVLIVIVGLSKPTIGNKDIIKGVQMIFAGILTKGLTPDGGLAWGYNAQNLGNMLFRATPIIMTGLSVAVAYKTGLFNIGAPGQYLMGTMASLSIALGIPGDSMPSWVIWLLAFLGGCLAGALWGAIPGMLKAFLNINEVLACIMANWIAAYLVSWYFSESSFRNVTEGTKTAYIYMTSYNGVATSKMGLDKLFPGSQVNGGFLVAVLIAVAMYILLNKTTLGYQLKACGSNRHAARYAGINDKRNIVLSMAIAGALAAGGASLYWLSGNTEFYWNTYQSLPGEGFDGISVALLASSNPIGAVFTGVFLSMLKVVGSQLAGFTAYNEYITDVIIGCIVYFSAFSLMIRMLLTSRKKKVPQAAAADQAGPVPAPDPSGDPAENEQEQEGGDEA